MPRVLLMMGQLGLLLLLAATQAVQAQPTTPYSGRVVFRVDASNPDQVFQGGIVNSAPSEGVLSNYDILDHALGAVCTAGRRSPWISTTNRNSELNAFLQRMGAEGGPLADGSYRAVDAWVYSIHTDDSYMNLVDVMAQVIQAGRDSLHGYTPSQAHTLQRMLDLHLVRDRGEVLTTYIAPERINLAYPVRIFPGGVLEWGQPVYNSGFQSDAPPTTNPLPPLAQTLPPTSQHFPVTVSVTPSNTTCFLTCDGTSASERLKRSATQNARLPAYCASTPTGARAFLGSEDL